MQPPQRRSIGRYDIEGLLGRGGMAEVYRAVDAKLGRTVAVKTILPTFSTTPTMLQRFLREARTVAALEHPNILPIYDLGEEDGNPFIVMPYLEAGTLARRIGPSGLPPETVADWIGQLGDALDAAHRSGILHRDIKPGNVLMGKDGRPVLADFGLARIHGETSDLTATGIILGTPHYMAPELAEGKPASEASDLYALGILAWVMLSGKTPFSGDTPVSILHQHVAAQVPSLSTMVRDLPPAIDAFFRKALSKDPAARPASGSELAGLLSGALKGAGVVSAEALAPTVADLETPPPVEEVRRKGAPLLPWIAAGVAVAVVSAALLMKFLPSGGEESGGLPGEPDPAVLEKAASVGEEIESVMREAMEEIESERLPEALPETEPGVPPPAEPFRPARQRDAGLGKFMERMRRPQPLTGQDFTDLAVLAGEALLQRPGDSTLQTLTNYAGGGLAYVAGDDDAARIMLEQVREAGSGKIAQSGLLAWMLTAGDTDAPVSDWEMAVAYGDARGEGTGLVEQRLQEDPGDVRARFGMALLNRTHGRHEEAITEARRVYETLGGEGSEAAGRIDQFVGDEFAELSQWKEAVEAYREAASHGGKLAATAGLRGGQIALEKLGDRSTALQLFRLSCIAGQRQACRRVADLERKRRR